MFARLFEKEIKRILASKGLVVNGASDSDPLVHNKQFYKEVFFHGSLGLGQAYINGWWSCKNLDLFFYKLLANGSIEALRIPWHDIGFRLKHMFLNQQTERKATAVCDTHYNQNVETFYNLLDQRLAYSCGHWPKEEMTLDESQELKLKDICEKLELKPGMHILDIGCGWGSFIKYAVDHYDVKCTGYSLAGEQVRFMQQQLKDLPIKIVHADYRHMTGSFDRIVSVEMFEAVGHKNYKTYMNKARSLLKSDGRFFLQTIARSKAKASGDRWVDKYIFPNGMLPTLSQIHKASTNAWEVHLLAERSSDYDRTLLAWRDNLDRNLKSEWPSDEQRKWEYYFSAFAGAFRAKHCLLYQLMLTPMAAS